MTSEVLDFPEQNKSFAGDFEYFLRRIRNREPFALSRFGDGELAILKGFRVGNAEFQYEPDQDVGGDFRQALWDSFTYVAPHYYVGIGCPCCVGQDDFEWMRDNSTQPFDRLTWNNVWVNSNYWRFRKELIPWLHEHATHVEVVCHAKAVTRFPVCHRILENAWHKYGEIFEAVKPEVERAQGRVFLFAAGPTSEPLIHACHHHNPENTYLDIGSALDPDLFPGEPPRRGYLAGGQTLYKTCAWG